MNKKEKNSSNEFEYKTNKEELTQKIEKINWWEWIPIIGTYLYFAKVSFARAYYVKEIRKATNRYARYFQHGIGLLILPFAIWTLTLAILHGWKFYYPSIAILIGIAIEFATPIIWKKLYLKGLLEEKIISKTSQ